MKIQRIALSLALSAFGFAGVAPCRAQSTDVARGVASPLAASAPTTVPALVPFSGTLPVAESGGMDREAAMTFLIFSNEQGGAPLWAETQSVSVDALGHYTVQLGASNSSGLPVNLFTSGEARWLEVQVSGKQQQRRILLASVPYAMKAAEAETLGGLASADYVTQAQLAATAKNLTERASPLITPFVAPTGGGTTNYIPLWTGSSALGNSYMFQAGPNVYLGTTMTPSALNVTGNISNAASGTYPNFTSSAYNNIDYEGPRMAFNRYRGSIAAPFAVKSGDTVGFFDFFAYDGSTLQRVAEFAATVGGTPSAGVVPGQFGINTVNAAGADTPRLIAYSNDNVTMSTHGGNVGIGTLTPAANLEVNGTAKFDGNITFASTQTFPVTGTGGGTITGIATSSPLTGSGTSGTVTVGLNTSALETTLNSDYAQLGAADTFGQPVTFEGGATSMRDTSGAAAFTGTGSNGSIGVIGTSDTGYGVYGSGATAIYGTSTTGFGGYFVSTSAGTAAVYISNLDVTDSYGVSLSVAGTAPKGRTIYSASTGNDATTVNAGSTGQGSVAVSGYASGPLDTTNPSAAVIPFGLAGFSSYGTGVQGTSGAASATYAKLQGPDGGTAGVWGDTNTPYDGTPEFAAVVGTADDNYGGIFANDSQINATIRATNYYEGGGGTGLFKVFEASTSKGMCGIGDGDLGCTGALKSFATTGGGARTVETYSVQSSENWMEDAGSGELVRGVAVVHIDPAFADTISEDAGYHVFLTPNGDSEGLYVIAKTPTTFEVRESKGGTSSLSFDYRIMAKRRGMEAQRLVDVTERFNAEMTRVKVKTGLEGASEIPGNRGPSRVERALPTAQQPRPLVPAPKAKLP